MPHAYNLGALAALEQLSLQKSAADIRGLANSRVQKALRAMERRAPSGLNPRWVADEVNPAQITTTHYALPGPTASAPMRESAAWRMLNKTAALSNLSLSKVGFLESAVNGQGGLTGSAPIQSVLNTANTTLGNAIQRKSQNTAPGMLNNLMNGRPVMPGRGPGGI